MFVAGGQALVGQLQVTQGVVLVHIDTGVVQHQVRLVQRQQVVKRVLDHLQVRAIVHAAGQGNVPIAFGLAGGEVLLAVQRHGDRFGGVVQDARGAVALVHVAVEDQDAVHAAGFQQVAADHRQVVEDAEPRRVVIVGMMGAAGQVAGDAVLQRQFGRKQRATHRAHRAPRQRLAPGQAQATLVLARQLTVHVALDVVAVVGQGEDVVGADLGAQQRRVGGQPAGDQVVAQQAELVHREAMVRREFRAVVVVVDQRQGHGGFVRWACADLASFAQALSA